MNNKIAFIGAGNMGYAMISSVAKSNILPAENILVFDVDKEKLLRLKEELNICTAASAYDAVKNADIVILAVKPNMVNKVLMEIKTAMDDKKILVSVAVGIPIKFYQGIVGADKRIVRTMPNTPALVGEGMTLMCWENVSDDEGKTVREIFECFGKVEYLDEKLMSEVTALTSSSPAYVFMFIEAMADAAVLSGIPRNLAYKLAAQAVLGSAKMVLETGKHPGELKDMVCSPAGTTIEAVSSLEKNRFRYAVIEAMNECTRKALEIGKKYD